MLSCPSYRVERTIQKPHSAFQRSLTSSLSKFEGTPTLIVLGGSARTLGNMKRPIIAANAVRPVEKKTQPTTTQETNRNVRRSDCEAATAEALDGLGKGAFGPPSFSRAPGPA